METRREEKTIGRTETINRGKRKKKRGKKLGIITKKMDTNKRNKRKRVR